VNTYVLVYWEQEASLSTVPPAHVKGELVVEEVSEVVTQQKSILAKQLLLVTLLDKFSEKPLKIM